MSDKWNQVQKIPEQILVSVSSRAPTHSATRPKGPHMQYGLQGPYVCTNTMIWLTKLHLIMCVCVDKNMRCTKKQEALTSGHMARKTSHIHKPNKEDLTQDTTNIGLCKGKRTWCCVCSAKNVGAVCVLLKMSVLCVSC
jgi:hypothetical protein